MLPVQPRAARQSPADSGAAGLVHYTYHTKKSPLFQGKTSFPIIFHANYHMLRPPPLRTTRWSGQGGCGGFFCSFVFYVLSFLSGKEKKEPKKRNLIGEGDERAPSGGPPPSSVTCFSLRGFSKKSPAKYLRGRQAPLTGGRGGIAGRVPGFLFWFSFLSPERKENVNIHRKERGKRFRKEKAGASDTALTPAHVYY